MPDPSSILCGRCGATTPSAPCDRCGQDPLLQGRYLLEAVLGRSASGTTFRARDLETGHEVAIRHAPLALAPDAAARQIAEAEAIRSLAHPGTSPYHDHFVVDEAGGGSLYLVQQYVDDVKAAEPEPPPLAEPEALSPAAARLVLSSALGVVALAGVSTSFLLTTLAPEPPRTATTLVAPPHTPPPTPEEAPSERVSVDGALLGSLPPRGARRASNPISIVVFADLQCRFSGRLADTLADLVAEHDDVVLHVRDFPSPFHEDAADAHHAARCAGEQGRYWHLYDQLIVNQDTLGPDHLEEHASIAELDVSLFSRCMTRGDYREAIEADAARGRALGVRGTPTSFVDGVRVVGAQPKARFETLLDEARRRRR